MAYHVGMIVAASLLLFQASQSGIVYSDAGAFSIDAPKGWVLDTKSGKPDGLDAVFYPSGGSWRASKAVMYARSVPKKGKTLDQYVVQEIKEFSKQAPGIEARDVKAKDASGKPLRMVFFTVPKPEAHETVAYIDSPKMVALLVLTSRDKKSYEAVGAAFKELVSSYRFVADKVEVKG